jgi:hypothetical protein
MIYECNGRPFTKPGAAIEYGKVKRLPVYAVDTDGTKRLHWTPSEEKCSPQLRLV